MSIRTSGELAPTEGCFVTRILSALMGLYEVEVYDIKPNAAVRIRSPVDYQLRYML